MSALDVTGPYEVFACANMILKKEDLSQEDVYHIKVLAEEKGSLTALSGMRMIADQSYCQIDETFDILMIPGGDPDIVLSNTKIVDLIKVIAPRVHRLASVCTGAFLLAESGVLDGCRATTHWNWCAEFDDRYPLVQVESERIFVKEGHVYTSGGVTFGLSYTPGWTIPVQ